MHQISQGKVRRTHTQCITKGSDNLYYDWTQTVLKCDCTDFRMLLPVPEVRRGRADPDKRALPKLHLPQPDAHVLPQSLPLHQTGGQKLRGRKETRPVLSHNNLSPRYLNLPKPHFISSLKNTYFSIIYLYIDF